MTSHRRALIVVDVQQEYFSGPLEIQHPPHAESLPRITAAIDAASAAGIPVVAAQHSAGDESPVFSPTTEGFALHPLVEDRATSEWKRITKRNGTVFSGTDLREWLRARDVDTITFIGYMTNNCIIASAADAETYGLVAEVLSDATGAINIANEAGFADARTVHDTLMTILHSNLAAVASTDAWVEAVAAGTGLPKSNLSQSAIDGAVRASQL